MNKIKFTWYDKFTGNMIFECPMVYSKIKAANGYYSKLKNKIQSSKQFNDLRVHYKKEGVIFGNSTVFKFIKN